MCPQQQHYVVHDASQELQHIHKKIHAHSQESDMMQHPSNTNTATDQQTLEAINAYIINTAFMLTNVAENTLNELQDLTKTIERSQKQIEQMEMKLRLETTEQQESVDVHATNTVRPSS